MILWRREMTRATGVVMEGRITLPEDVLLPEGTRVVVEWDEGSMQRRPYLERQPLTEEDVQHDIAWATGKRWKKPSS
jgi:hypothetical protein